MVSTFGRGYQQIQAAARNLLARVHVVDRLAQMASIGVIRRVRGDRHVPVVNGQHVDGKAQLCTGVVHAIGRAPSSAKKIDSFQSHGTGLTLHRSFPGR